jgi:hypothetical protein
MLSFYQGALPSITIHVASSPTGSSVHIPVMGKKQGAVCRYFFYSL